MRWWSGKVKLAFLGHPFESLSRALDSILAVIAVGRKQADDFVSTTRGWTCDIARSEIDGLSNGKLVLQHPLHHAKTPAVPTLPLQGRLKTPRVYSTARAALASQIGTGNRPKFINDASMLPLFPAYLCHAVDLWLYACQPSFGSSHTVSTFAIVMVSARPALVHSWNAGSAIIVSM
jgi:hypothetical protein